jgi:hypothetical protein
MMSEFPKRLRIKNRCALQMLILFLSYAAIGGWLLWQSAKPEGDPSFVALIALAIAVAILFDDCRERQRE